VLRQTAGANDFTNTSTLQQTGTSLDGIYTPGGGFEAGNEAIYSWGDYNGTLLLGLLNSGESKLLEYDVFVRGTSQFDMCGSSGCGATNASIGDPFTLSSNISPDNIGVVPVPAAVWLFGSGLVFIVGFARRKVTA